MGAARSLSDRYRPRTSRVVLLAAALLVLNVPVLVSATTAFRLATHGIEVTGEVVETQAVGTEESPLRFVSFRMEGEVDPRETTWRTQMEPAAWAEAERVGEVAVTVLPGDPSTFAVEGARRDREGLWFALSADGVLLAVAVAGYRRGRRAHDAGREPRLVAEGDLERVRAGEPHAWRRRRDGSVEVCGEVVAIRDDEVELRVADRHVAVVLAGHRNGAGFRGLARVTCRPDAPGG